MATKKQDSPTESQAGLAEKLRSALGSMGEMRVSPPILATMAVLSVIMIAASLWFTVRDLSGLRAFNRTNDLAQEAVSQLAEIANSLEALLQDSKVQAAARTSLESGSGGEDLLQLLQSRVPEILGVQLLSAEELASFDPVNAGPNGFALYEMLLLAEAGARPQLQLHGSLQPPALVDVVALRTAPESAQDEAPAGYLIIQVDPGYVLDRFNPDVSGSYLKLEQFNGRLPATSLKQIGEAQREELAPQRLPVGGTLFRLEMPQAAYTEVMGSGLLVLMLVVSVLMLAASLFLHRQNRRWEVERLAHALAASEREYRRELEGGARPAEQPEADSSAPAPRHERRGAGQPKGVGESESQPVRQAARDVADPPPMRLRYDIVERPRSKQGSTEVELTAEIFRAYDIRGIIGKTLDAGVARQVGHVLGSMALEIDAGPVVVARDGRLSGPDLVAGMVEGITASGCDVLDIGMVPTGVLYYAAFEKARGTAVMITGSHNPPDYNGFKIMVGGHTLFGTQIREIYQRIVQGKVRNGSGQVDTADVLADYRQRIASDIKLERPLRVVIDCGNGVGGVVAADVLRDIGAEVLPLFDEVDGEFPNHHPDPSDPENLQDLIESVRLMDADIGLALDGDADRLGVVTLGGSIIFPDRIMMLLAMDVLDRVPGATIIYDVKCTGDLAKVIEQAGGKAVMYKTGHSLIKAYMKEINSPFAGEMSGHFFFGERWYGVDDGIYAAARLLEILAAAEQPPEAILNALPSSYSTPELKVQMQEGQNHEFIDALQAKARFEGAKVSTIDGVRADFDDGWGLVRASNTTPILVVRFDAESEEALKRIKNVFRAKMLAVNPDLELPF